MSKAASRGKRIAKWLLILLLVGVVLGAIALVGGYYGLQAYYGPKLPDIAELDNPELKVPLRVYSSEGELISEFGAERRAPKRFDELPPVVVEAFLAAEDDRFFEHPGVDWQGLSRAAWVLLTTGEKQQGGSTITMQLARNYFLTNEQTYERKLKEILLALRIEDKLSKQEILERYLNKIFMGNRAYGVGAAAEVYYGVDIAEVTLPQAAMIAGLPKAPSRYNPIVNPERALLRRNYVLRRMRELGYITPEAFETARNEAVTATLDRDVKTLRADYVAEMVRADMVKRFGQEGAYTGGYSVTTTIRADEQAAATAALQTALLEYDWRHEYRGPEVRASELQQALDTAADEQADGEATGEDAAVRQATLVTARMRQRPQIQGLPIARVTAFEDGQLTAELIDGTALTIQSDGLKWAKLDDDNRPAEGDLIRVRQVEPASDDAAAQWKLAQLPEAQAAFVALDPQDGRVVALVGGFDYFLGKFNRVTQARRQPGSLLKPFLYSAGLANGFTPASVINDAPVVFEDRNLEDTWRPENYTGRFYGPTRLREALVRSRNLVSIRLLRQLGIDVYRDYLERFGFPREHLQRDLSLALGTAILTPMEVARGYAVFANGGFLVEPYLIAEIRDADGEIVHRAAPRPACDECDPELPPIKPDGEPVDLMPAPRVIDPVNAYLMTSIMQDVVQRGTARRAKRLGRSDLAGKTGTTNDEMDAWFAGFNAKRVGVGWVGYDKLRPLGSGEAGGRASLPMWMDYMRVALADTESAEIERPPGIVTVRIDPRTGERAGYGTRGALFELFAEGTEPEEASLLNPSRSARDETETVEDLF